MSESHRFRSVNSVSALSNHIGLNLINVKTTKGDEVTMAAPPISRSLDTDKSLPPPPKLGEHTAKIVKEFEM